ncbi:hypothetical protein Bpfe_028822 [Biomphalaria pfeifferi]|uniref:Uncharacterized protein n=1 Tax=Biomphalaria pfeifferi TaxID=112525 RepID=A0AAD8EVU0_BIOPF|nr:hypothetical protein Bpfe_028822 [Biomphalaria pfeifferi]
MSRRYPTLIEFNRQYIMAPQKLGGIYFVLTPPVTRGSNIPLLLPVHQDKLHWQNWSKCISNSDNSNNDWRNWSKCISKSDNSNNDWRNWSKCISKSDNSNNDWRNWSKCISKSDNSNNDWRNWSKCISKSDNSNNDWRNWSKCISKSDNSNNVTQITLYSMSPFYYYCYSSDMRKSFYRSRY